MSAEFKIPGEGRHGGEGLRPGERRPGERLRLRRAAMVLRTREMNFIGHAWRGGGFLQLFYSQTYVVLQ